MFYIVACESTVRGNDAGTWYCNFTTAHDMSACMLPPVFGTRRVKFVLTFISSGNSVGSNGAVDQKVAVVAVESDQGEEGSFPEQRVNFQRSGMVRTTLGYYSQDRSHPKRPRLELQTRMFNLANLMWMWKP